MGNYSSESVTSTRKIKKKTNQKYNYNKIKIIRGYLSNDHLEITGVVPQHPRDRFKDRLRRWKRNNRLRKRDGDDAKMTQVRL